MNEEKFVVRRSKKKQYGFVIMTGVLILWYFIGPYEKTRIIYTESPTFTIILGIIFLGLFFYFLNELIKQQAEIILTKEGIELRDKGFLEWNMIDSFSTLNYRYSDNHKEDLVFHFKEFADLKIDITNLEKNKEELVELITEYKGSARLFFVGHNSK